MACVCSGHSSNCSSASGWYEDYVVAQWSASNDLSDVWTGMDDEGDEVPVDSGFHWTDSGYGLDLLF